MSLMSLMSLGNDCAVGTTPALCLHRIVDYLGSTLDAVNLACTCKYVQASCKRLSITLSTIDWEDAEYNVANTDAGFAQGARRAWTGICADVLFSCFSVCHVVLDDTSIHTLTNACARINKNRIRNKKKKKLPLNKMPEVKHLSTVCANNLMLRKKELSYEHTRLLQEIQLLPSLTYLELTRCQLDGSCGGVIAQMHTLTTLRIRMCIGLRKQQQQKHARKQPQPRKQPKPSKPKLNPKPKPKPKPRKQQQQPKPKQPHPNSISARMRAYKRKKNTPFIRPP